MKILIKQFLVNRLSHDILFFVSLGRRVSFLSKKKESVSPYEAYHDLCHSSYIRLLTYSISPAIRRQVQYIPAGFIGAWRTPLQKKQNCPCSLLINRHDTSILRFNIGCLLLIKHFTMRIYYLFFGMAICWIISCAASKERMVKMRTTKLVLQTA